MGFGYQFFDGLNVSSSACLRGAVGGWLAALCLRWRSGAWHRVSLK
jgi:hypothetical protein